MKKKETKHLLKQVSASDFPSCIGLFIYYFFNLGFGLICAIALLNQNL